VYKCSSLPLSFTIFVLFIKKQETISILFYSLYALINAINLINELRIVLLSLVILNFSGALYSSEISYSICQLS